MDEPGLGELFELRELVLETRGRPSLPTELARLSLDRLRISNSDWPAAIDVIASIPVRVDVTLLEGHPDAAEWLEQKDLTAWKELQEMEIDASEDFEPRVFERKLKRCGFAINRQRKVDWEIGAGYVGHRGPIFAV